MKGGSIMNNIIEYIKNAKTAFQTYIDKDDIDYNLCKKIYDYIQNAENLNDNEKNELDEFINENTIRIINIANIYTNPENKKTLKKQFIKMMPLTIAKPDSRIYKANGNFSSLNSQNIKRPIKIKTYPKKAA